MEKSVRNKQFTKSAKYLKNNNVKWSLVQQK